MIRKILTYYAERLEEYLSRTHRRPEGLATVGMIGNSTEERPNKMVVSLLNVERETAVGGSDTSAHCHGYAFDLVPVNRQMRAFKRFCRDFLAGRAFDQLISEGRRTQLDARGLQTSRRQAAAQTVLLDDTRKILSHDGLTL